MSTKLLVFALISISAFADIVSISPVSLDFGNQFVGSPSSQPATLTNSTKKVLNISRVTAMGSFLVQGSPCGSTLAPGEQCAFFIVFSPTAAGPRAGILSVNDDANITPQEVKLSGTGVAVVLTSIAVAPATSTVPLGLTEQFTATGTFNNGTSQDVTGSAPWSSASLPSRLSAAPGWPALWLKAPRELRRR
jgi:hypothetical protein